MKNYMVYNGEYWSRIPAKNNAEAINFCNNHKIKIIKIALEEEWLKQL